MFFFDSGGLYLYTGVESTRLNHQIVFAKATTCHHSVDNNVESYQHIFVDITVDINSLQSIDSAGSNCLIVGKAGSNLHMVADGEGSDLHSAANSTGSNLDIGADKALSNLLLVVESS
jgi:hypothetical protein